MKRIISAVVLCAAPLTGLLSQTASAQWVVYDPANHIQSIIQAVQAVEEVTNQIQQLTHEIEMLENMARDLESLPGSVAGDILSRMQRVDELMRRAEGIGYRVEQIEREYESAYPEEYQGAPRQAELVEEARTRWRQSRAAYRDSLMTTAEVVSSARTDSDTLNNLIADSQSAVGNLQAMQAGNQLQALQTQQLMQLEAMWAAHIRAEALERAHELAEAERGRARLRTFLRD
ncbi:MAG: P-type conjugative transfer protein TrbJ [Hyphomonas sp. 34-62-18]|nr:P-type conjugative transfer protein TrbJ [Hyphomonas sp. 34-62-18]OZB19113.1 MAG: P-type conjugative transfer protein TrbJ [Hyphomonas sp. 34-62-18]